MAQFSNLQVRFLQGLPSQSPDRTAAAIYQFVTEDTDKFLIQIDANCHFEFTAVYKYDGTFYPHPYTLRTAASPLENNTEAIGNQQQIIYAISLYLELKRLQDFAVDDLKRYYATIDKSIDTNEDIQDFHDVYLRLDYTINGQTSRYDFNNGQPIHLPTLVSNPWTSKNTLTRFRYDAENRDGTFHCEMTLRHANFVSSQSYKIVLCLTSNTIPARMDNHVLRWICKVRSRTPRSPRPVPRRTKREKTYNLNHKSGIVVAEVFGPKRKFSPQTLFPTHNLNFVRSCFESKDYTSNLQTCDYRGTGTLAIVVTKGTDYPHLMTKRRRDGDILRYLPFNELEDIDRNLNISNAKVIQCLKRHKEQCAKQLIFFDENERGTFSQSHVRLYAAAYDEHDVLLTETLYPPLRNSKVFEQLRATTIVQPKNELRAYDSACVYCEYDCSKPKRDYEPCPYQFELGFSSPLNVLSDEQLLKLFDEPHICLNAAYVPNCQYLLQFQVPNELRFDKRRVFIRLRHTHSKDYNPSAVALNDKECWIYYADSNPVANADIELIQNLLDGSTNSYSANSDQNVGLQIQPIHTNSIPDDSIFDSEESNQDREHSPRDLHTPDNQLQTRFAFPNISSQTNNPN